MNSNMQNSKMVFTFSVSYQKHPILLSLRPYGSRDFKIDSCRQHGFFILLQSVQPSLWIVFEHYLKNV